MKGVAAMILLMGCFSTAQASMVTKEDTLVTATGNIYGTFTEPAALNGSVAVLMIAGSGPTDRDGNNVMMKNNSLLFLSDSLVAHGMATLRYDKRGIAKSAAASSGEANLRFENYIDDAVAWIKWLKQQKRYSKVIVMGHSEGSLIGMIAAQQAGADAYVSIAGAGYSADKILRVQLHDKAPTIADSADRIMDSLVKGKTVEHVDQKLFTIFRPSVQPYIISWFKYDPAKEIAKLKIPVLIVQGTSDIQVSVDNAQQLAKAKPDAELAIIDHMNHVLKETGPSKEENMPAYTNPTMPIVPKLASTIYNFIAKAWAK